MTNIEQIRQISVQDLAALGLQDVAYVKAERQDGQTLFAVYAADGTRLAMMPKRETAIAVVRQNDLEPLSVH